MKMRDVKDVVYESCKTTLAQVNYGEERVSCVSCEKYLQES